VIVLITDGENHEADAVEVARKAAEMGIRIYTIGIGTPEGAPIEIDGEFVKDENDEMVVSKLNEKMLEEIASLTEAAYVRASKQSIGLEEIVKSINEMERSELTTVKYEEYNEQYQYLVAVALALLLMDILVLSRRNPRLRRFNIFRE
jgi:Ca-activated chloride channel family protein